MLATLRVPDLQYGPLLSGCTEGTRLDTLERINEWITDLDAPNILWLKGHPGIGKTAIATSVVENLEKMNRLGSGFFFQRSKAAVMTASVLWCSVAYDLARRYHIIREGVISALRAEEISPTTVNVDKLFHLLIEQPITESEDISDDNLPVVVIDGLDECGGLDGPYFESRRRVIRSLENWSRLPGRFKLIVTSREESDIAKGFSGMSHYPIDLSAGLTVEGQSSVDIRAFLTRRFQQVVYQYKDLLSPDWPGPQVIEELVDKSAGLFILAKTTVDFISLEDPQRRLDLVLQGVGAGNLHAMYTQVLSESFPHPGEDELRHFHRVVGTIILSKEPLSFLSLQRLLSMETPALERICNGLHSVMRTQDALKFHHPSFVDFLMDPDGCPSTFLIKRDQEARKITLACFRVMKETLRFNICNLKSSYLRNADIENLDSLVEQCIPHHVSYSSRFWAHHLAETPFHDDLFEALRYFMERQFLFWLEVLSLTRSVNLVSSPLRLLVDWIQVR
jgi:hypothetical protein